MKKVVFYPYSSKFSEKFFNLKRKIQKITNEQIDIHHIGSTAVPGLGGKGFVDALIGLNSWKESEKIIKCLKKIGFTHIHPKEKGRIFLSNKKESKPGDFHIHIVLKNTEQYQDFLRFRDLLRSNSKIKKDYENAKKDFVKTSGSDREKYKKLKSRYINSIFEKRKMHERKK